MICFENALLKLIQKENYIYLEWLLGLNIKSL